MWIAADQEGGGTEVWLVISGSFYINSGSSIPLWQVEEGECQWCVNASSEYFASISGSSLISEYSPQT